MRKYISITLLSLIFLFSCSPQEGFPEDVEAMKAMLTSLKSDKSALDVKIKTLETEIEKLEPSKEKPKKLVTASYVTKEDFNRYIDIQGGVMASNSVSAVPEIGGRILSMKFEEGDFVKAGSVVAVIGVESLSKQVSELETSLELATDMYERQSKLWKQEIGSEMQYLQAKNNKERLEKSLETLKFQLTKATVFAPISGYVDLLFLKEGEFAGPGTPILQIINTNIIKVVADVPETFLGKVKKNEMVNIEFPALDLKKKGKVSLIGRSIDPANRTFKVEVEMVNPNNALKPNLLSIVKINDLTVKDAITVPLDLVQQEISGKDYVFVIVEAEDGLISEKRYVTTGPTFENLIVIESGINDGDRIIVDGARGLTSAEPIQIQE